MASCSLGISLFCLFFFVSILLLINCIYVNPHHINICCIDPTNKNNIEFLSTNGTVITKMKKREKIKPPHINDNTLSGNHIMNCLSFYSGFLLLLFVFSSFFLNFTDNKCSSFVSTTFHSLLLLFLR